MAGAGHSSAWATAIEPPSVDDIGREHFRRYTRVCFLGKGGFAEVSKYIDNGSPASSSSSSSGAGSASASTGREVAIKSVNRATYREGVNLGAVKELQAMAELEHENVVRVSGRGPGRGRTG
jgi:serine/threonine protein kinase